MKRWIAIIILAFYGVIMARAQDKSLNITPFLSESYSSSGNVTLVTLSGDQLKVKGMRKYASVSVTGDSELADKISKAVKKDGVKSVSKETTYKDGKLYLGFYNLGGKGDRRQYLFYLDKRPT
ncbi:MAG: hypothetical protein K2G13_09115, partial [Muribaculaceae bacterium]|nr:hypothetical protein [Muribaculaceae bacterium]